MNTKQREGYDMLNEREQMTWDILADPSLIDELAEEHEVSPQTIRNIKMLKSKRALAVWGIMEELDVKTWTITPTRRLTEAEVAEIRSTAISSVTLAKRYGVSPSTVRMCRARLTYRELA